MISDVTFIWKTIGDNMVVYMFYSRMEVSVDLAVI